MSRMIRHEATGPHELKPQEKSAWICMCGLSRNYPLCDGAHKKARQEEPGKCYIYDRNCQDVVEVKDDAA